MKKNNITLIFGSLEEEHLGKDVFLVPYYFGKLFNMNVCIVYSETETNKNLPRNIRGVELIPLKNIFINTKNELLRNLINIMYVLFHAFRIDILMQFYFSNPSVIMGLVYKALNKRGFMYIKSDGKMGEWPLLGYYNSIYTKEYQKIQTHIKKYFYMSFLKQIDLITVETNIGYNKLCAEKLLNLDLRKKVRMLFSGFDKEQFEQYGFLQKGYSQKENIIITVGRLGCYPKNTEMLLKAAERIDFKDWKLVLIGPIEKKENDFQKTIDAFYSKKPLLKDHVFFTGPIYDKKHLWKWYNRAKIFILPSIYESFGIVLIEALFFKNYIVSTDVGAASDLIEMGYGQIIPQNDPMYLSNVLQEIINEDNLKKLYEQVSWNNNDISWEKFIKDAISEVMANYINTNPQGVF
jgi:glycosyltransferase involved in cell wall biosynthesis